LKNFKIVLDFCNNVFIVTKTSKQAANQWKHANTPTRQHANTPTRQHANTPTKHNSARLIPARSSNNLQPRLVSRAAVFFCPFFPATD
jgi:hypothetical protein